MRISHVIAVFIVLHVVLCATGCDDEETSKAAIKPPSAAARAPSIAPKSNEPTTPAAIAEVEKRCTAGELDACIHVADQLRRKPRATSAELQRPLQLYQNACDRKLPDGCAGLGAMHQEGLGVPRDLARALSLYRQACDARSGRGCARLGALYAVGSGVPKDPERALGYSQAACDLDDGLGCMNVGVMYQHGDGVPVDAKRARELLSKACALREGGGCRQLGTLYASGYAGQAPNPRWAVMLSEKACAQGDAVGCGNAGMNHQVGFGVPRDSARAVIFYDRACKLGETRFCDLLQRFAASAESKAAQKP